MHFTCNLVLVTLKGLHFGFIQNAYGPHQVHKFLLEKSIGLKPWFIRFLMSRITLTYIQADIGDHFTMYVFAYKGIHLKYLSLNLEEKLTSHLIDSRRYGHF